MRYAIPDGEPVTLLHVENVSIEDAVARLRAIEDPEEFAAAAARVLAAVVAAVAAIDDPQARMVAAHKLMPAWNAGTVGTSDLRHVAAVLLRNGAGWEYPDYYGPLDAGKSTVQAILRGRAGLAREAPERG